jgi:hypothetical protein
MSELTRREALARIAGVIASAGAIDRVAAQQVHQLAAQDAAATSGLYAPKALTAHEFATVERLADLIIPVENGAPGALTAGVPAWIDLIVGSNAQLAATYRAGIRWLDQAMQTRGAPDFVRATAAQQTEWLDRIAYQLNSTPELEPGIEFFAWVRRMTVDGFYTSRIGMRDLYLGNTPQASFSVPQEAIDHALRRSGL